LAALTAAACALAVMVFGAVLAVAADAVLHLPVGWRVVLLAAWLGVGGVAAVRLWRPVADAADRDAAVILVERTFGQLHARLATAVQLADARRRAAEGVSDDLYWVVARQAEQACASLDPAAAVPVRPYLRRWLAVLGVLVVSAGCAGLVGGQTTWIGLKRLFAPWAQTPWPTRTRIVLSADNKLLVRKGGTLVLNGHIEGQHREQGTIRVWPAGQAGAAYRSRFAIEPDGRFCVRYRPVTRDLQVQLQVGDARTPKLAVRMVPPPEIESLKLVCTFPEYTGLGRQEYLDGNLEAIYQTKVRVVVTANKPLARAVLAWQDGTDTGDVQPMRLGPQDRAVAEFRVDRTASYQVHLTDALGFSNDEPVTYRIEMIDNEYPQIRNVRPKRTKNVTADARLPITAEVVDDFALSSVRLCYRVRSGAGDAATATRRVGPGRASLAGAIELPLAAGTKRAGIRYVWELENLALAEGTEVEYWLEARDLGEHAKAQAWPRCSPRRLRILNRAKLVRQLNRRVDEILERLTQVEQLQSESADAVSGAARSVRLTGRADVPLEIARAEKWRQERLARRTAELAELLAAATNDYLISGVGQPRRLLMLKRASELLKRLAAEPMPEAVLKLDQAIAALRQWRREASP